MHTPINSRATPIHSLTTTPARTTDPQQAFPSEHLFLAADANDPADQAGHARGHAGVQMGSHRKGSSSPQLVAIQPQGQDSSALSLRHCEEATNTEAEGTPSLFDDVDQARRLEAMRGEREGSAAKMLSHQSAESSGLDIDAFLPPSLSPRQARITALPPPKTLQELQEAVSGFAMCIIRSCLLVKFCGSQRCRFLVQASGFVGMQQGITASLCVCVFTLVYFMSVCLHACMCSCVCVCSCMCDRVCVCVCA